MNAPFIFGAGGGGGKGGSEQQQQAPSVAPNTLRSKNLARLIDLVSEGPIGGLVNGLQSVFNDEVALQNPDGSFTQQNARVFERVGLPVQDPIPGFPGVQTEVNVNQVVKSQMNVLDGVDIISSSSDWSSANVMFTGDFLGSSGEENGVQAVPTVYPQGHAVIVGGKITQIIIDNPGKNVLLAPTVSVFGNGSSIVARARIGGGVSESIADPDLDAIRVKIRLGQFYYQDEDHNVQNTVVRFLIQCKSSNDSHFRAAYVANAFFPYTGVSPVTSGLKTQVSLQVPANTPYELAFRYRRYGSSTWITGDTFKGHNTSSSPVVFYPIMVALALADGQYEVSFIETYGNPVGSLYSTLYYHKDDAYLQIGPGKTTSGYEEEFRVDLPKGGAPWVVRVIRIQTDAINDKIQNQMSWSSYTAVKDVNWQYADSAVYGIVADSQYNNGQVPTRSYDVYGRLVSVPSNYDAFNRTYTGLWDGTFKTSWTNNPVWCFVDILLHERYGLGQWIKAELLDFAALYQIALYCDEQVDNGQGGTEPRFTFNTQIMNADEAFSVLNMFASVFRGMIYWSAGGITATQDSPGPVRRLVHRGNVLSEGFSYTGVPLNARHSVVLVTWNDPDNFYKNTTDVYEDPELIDKYGYITTELRAWGCTSRGQALRMARWVLDTEKFATQVVTYRAGFDHDDCRPGEIIAVSDPEYAGKRQGGRIAGATINSITMDAPYNFSANETYTLSVAIPTWGRIRLNHNSNIVIGNRTMFGNTFKPIMANDVLIAEGDPGQYKIDHVIDDTHLYLTDNYPGVTTSDGLNYSIYRNGILLYSSYLPIVEAEVQNIGGDQTVVPLEVDLPAIPAPGAPFMITGTDIAPRLFRVLNVKEVDSHTWEISGLEHDPTKYDRVENGYQAVTTPKLVDDRSALAVPATISVTESLYRANNQVRSKVTVSWEPIGDGRVMFYQLIYSYNGSSFQLLQGTPDTTYEFLDAPPGRYTFGVKAVALVAPSSQFLYTDFVALGKTAPPADVPNFRADRNVNGVQLFWDAVEDIDVVGYEIREGLSWDAGVVITTQKNGTAEFITLIDAVPHTFWIKALDDTGNYSVNAMSVTASVTRPDDVTGFEVRQDNDRLIFKWDRVNGQDIRYDIREGEEWATGRPVAIVSGNDANVMYPLTEQRSFYIKALSPAGLYSLNAPYATLFLVSTQNRNMVYSSDRAQLSWPGSLFNVVRTGFEDTELALADGQLTGHISFQILLGYVERIRARCWYDSRWVSDAGTPAWQDALFTWNSPEAQVAWRPLLDVGNAKVEFFISVDDGTFDPAFLEVWTFETNYNGQIVPLEPINTPTPWVGGTGVLATGAVINEKMTKPMYTIDVTSTFSVQLSVVVENPAILGPVNTGHTALNILKIVGVGKFMHLTYNRDAATPYFKLSDGIPANDLKINKAGSGPLRITFAINQDTLTRSLYIYDWDSTVAEEVSNSAPQNGAYTGVAL